VVMGPLQLVAYVVQNHHAGEQGTHWEKINTRINHSKWWKLFVFLVPVHFLLSSMGWMTNGPVWSSHPLLSGQFSKSWFFTHTNAVFVSVLGGHLYKPPWPPCSSPKFVFLCYFYPYYGACPWTETKPYVISSSILLCLKCDPLSL